MNNKTKRIAISRRDCLKIVVEASFNAVVFEGSLLAEEKAHDYTCGVHIFNMKHVKELDAKTIDVTTLERNSFDINVPYIDFENPFGTLRVDQCRGKVLLLLFRAPGSIEPIAECYLLISPETLKVTRLGFAGSQKKDNAKEKDCHSNQNIPLACSFNRELLMGEKITTRLRLYYDCTTLAPDSGKKYEAFHDQEALLEQNSVWHITFKEKYAGAKIAASAFRKSPVDPNNSPDSPTIRYINLFSSKGGQKIKSVYWSTEEKIEFGRQATVREEIFRNEDGFLHIHTQGMFGHLVDITLYEQDMLFTKQIPIYKCKSVVVKENCCCVPFGMRDVERYARKQRSAQLEGGAFEIIAEVVPHERKIASARSTVLSLNFTREAKKPVRSTVSGVMKGISGKFREEKKEENVTPSDKYKLESTFALKQLFAFAEKDSMAMFCLWMADVFGDDIPAEAYGKLYKDAGKKKSSINPPIAVVKSLGKNTAAYYKGEDARYRNHILVSERIIDQVLKNKGFHPTLMLALVEEFGHHLDYLLRHEYSNRKGDAPGDEGAAYSSRANLKYKKFLIDPFHVKRQHYATLSINGEKKPLIWDFSDIHYQLKEFVDHRVKYDDDYFADFEFFGAGMGDSLHGFGHQAIEEKAFANNQQLGGKTNHQRKQVYLGNWMRDFSQFIDPMVVRPMANAMDAVSRAQIKSKFEDSDNWMNFMKEMDKVFRNTDFFDQNSVTVNDHVKLRLPTFKPSFFNVIQWESATLSPVKLSREAITSFVELLALKELGEVKKQKGKDGKPQNYMKYLEDFRKSFVKITPDILGVYKPQEHIDNPKALMPAPEKPANLNHQLDPDFVKDPVESQWNINKTFGTRNYIRGNGPEPFPSAYDCFLSFIYKADPKTSTGRIHFGAAMHILEDYYAHTNFCELAVMKYHPNVFPWDNPSAKCLLDTNRFKSAFRKHSSRPAYFVVQSGSFGMLDTMASIIPKINDKLFSIELKEEEKLQPGERTFADALIYEFLLDISKAQAAGGGKDNTYYADIFLNYLSIRDRIADLPKPLKWIVDSFGLLDYFSRYIQVIKNAFYHFLILSAVNLIDDYQTLMDNEYRPFMTKNARGEWVFDTKKIEQWKVNKYGPTHTQLSKDSGFHPLHDLAIDLAVEAAKEMGDVFVEDNDWRNKIIKLARDKYFLHPMYTDWMDRKVTDWCTKHPIKVKQAYKASILLEVFNHGKEELKELKDKIRKLNKK